ncbi:GAF and ANTAR domain-containing protein [Streptomyces cylindrosporus]|uniref:ANTAR domain-containing protein n=1 Tax=Streptomyces cylindrosporus TaxID=2927583 RepID=A0ABS9YGY2_9ACTN|nr:GAF and ANTAR domain-containing protein [Streptomyces cylindrosporus]MCI3276507.1 ANTAR domain-containing protein [Streptomyces cylindrosporus]
MHHTTRELRLATALVEAADTLHDDFDSADYVRRLADRCVELLTARAAGVMLVDGGREVSLVGCSEQEHMALDLLRSQHSGGPCLESYGSGRPVPPVAVDTARAASRWPEFTERALRHDIVATYAVPLRCREQLLGAVNVFTPVPLDGSPDGATELLLAQLLADCAAHGLRNNMLYDRCRTVSGQLRQALSSRIRVEQAKGMLAERWQVHPDRAFTALRRYARRRQQPLDEVARAVLSGTANDSELLRDVPGTSGGPAGGPS